MSKACRSQMYVRLADHHEKPDAGCCVSVQFDGEPFGGFGFGGAGGLNLAEILEQMQRGGMAGGGGGDPFGGFGFGGGFTVTVLLRASQLWCQQSHCSRMSVRAGPVPRPRLALG